VKVCTFVLVVAVGVLEEVAGAAALAGQAGRILVESLLGKLIREK